MQKSLKFYLTLFLVTLLVFSGATYWGYKKTPIAYAAAAYVTGTSAVAACTTSACTATTGTVDTTGATLLVMVIHGANGCQNPASATVSDNLGNTWTQQGGFVDCANSGIGIDIWYSYNKSGGALSTGNDTFSGSMTSGGVAINVSSYSGTQTSSDPFDQKNSGHFSSVSGFTAPSVTPSVNGEVIINAAGEITGNPAGSVALTGYTVLGLNTSTSYQQFDAYLVQPTAGASAPTWSNLPFSGQVAYVNTFKAASSGPSPGPVGKPVLIQFNYIDKDKKLTLKTWTSL